MLTDKLICIRFILYFILRYISIYFILMLWDYVVENCLLFSCKLNCNWVN
uniref:Uncharacterized protein n=1 Tax=Aster yellows phytoplasma TaxID=35779 RepID=Q847P9_ASTYP|nr:hypothetical protein [Aster yellows phytoplasma]